MNSRTFLKWISAWAAIVLAQGALLSAKAATVVYDSRNPPSGAATETKYSDGGINFNMGTTYEDELLFKVEFDGRADRAYSTYFWVQGHRPGVDENNKGNYLDPAFCDGLDGSVLNEFQHYTRIYRIPAGARWGRIAAKDAAWMKNITVSIVSVSEAMEVYDSIWNEVNEDGLLQTVLAKYPIPADPFAKLPNFKKALLEGTKCRIHLLGDSIISDTWTSSFETLIQCAYPDSNLEFSISYGDNRGCEYYSTNFDTSVPGDTDVLVIGGISNLRVISGDTTEAKLNALKSVISQATAKGMEVLYLSTEKSYDSRGITDYTVLTEIENNKDLWYTQIDSMEWDAETDVWAQRDYFPTQRNEVLAETGVQCWDVFPQYQEFVYQSGRPFGWFNRDPAHNNARGRELLSRVLFEYVKAGVPVPGGDSNEDAAASTNFVGVARVKVPAKLNEKVLIAVPWINGVTAGVDNPVSVSNLVKTANLRENDQLWWYDSVNSKYMVWKINAQTNWTEVTTVTKGDEFEEDKFEAATAPDSKLLARGDAVLLWRVNSEDWSKPVYLSGMDTDSPVTFTFGKKAGLSLFAPPSVSNLAGVDFTKATWTGLSTGDLVKFINAKGAMVSFTWKSGKWNGLGSKVIPIGIGAWFCRATDGDEVVTVSFPGDSSGK